MNRYIATLITLFCLTNIAKAEQAETYLNGSKNFLEIKDVNRQAESWATCSATYDVMASILKSSDPAQSQKVKEYSNGADVAVTMTHVLDGLNDKNAAEKFDSLWAYSKVIGKELPKTKMTMILADAEAYGDKKANLFMDKLAATLEVCISNLEAQQFYIDSWRDLAKSGLLKIPNE